MARYKRATQNLLFADGRQHIDWSLKDKTWKDSPADGRVRVTMNYIKPILRSRAQRLMSSDVVWSITPSSNDAEERDRSKVGTSLLQARWRKTKMDARVRLALFLADNCGVAYLKQFWNPNLGPLTTATIMAPHPQTGQLTAYPIDADGNVLADDQGNPLEGNDLAFRYRPGDTDTAVRTIFNIRTNLDAEGLDPNEGFRWLIDAQVLPISTIKEMWGDRAKNVSSTASVGPMRTYERIIRAIANREQVGNDLVGATGGSRLPDHETTLYLEYWEAPTKPNAPGRFCVLGGDELLYPLTDQGDQEGLPQGIVPYIAVYSERRPLDGTGRPIVDDLIAPQKVINRQWGTILTEQGLAAVGQWIGFDVPGLFDQITNMTGSHIKVPMQQAYANRSIGDLIQRLAPPAGNAERWRLIQEAKATMFDIGAFHEIQRGQVPPGVTSGVAVQLLQEAENGQMHDPVQNLRESLQGWAHQTLTFARWGYGKDEERWIPAGRKDMGYLVESVKGLDLPDPDTVDISLDGFKPQSKAALNADIKEAMIRGWLEPNKGLQLMDLGRGIEGAFESEGRHYIRARRQNLAVERGEYQLIPAPPETPQGALGFPYAFVAPDGSPFVLPTEDDHAICIAVHQEIALDDTKPWPVRQAILMLIAERRAILSQQVSAAAKNSQPPKQPNVALAGKLDPGETAAALAAAGVNAPPPQPTSPTPPEAGASHA